MTAVLALLLGASLALPARAQEPSAARSESCAVCHGAEAKEFSRGVHGRAGIDCITCHGGVSGEVDVAKAHGGGLRALDDPRAAVDSCGGCHSDVEQIRSFGLRTDQLSLYWTSRHGAKLSQDGDANVATCVTCHGSHFVLSVRDPLSPVHRRHQAETCGRCHSDETLMAGYGLRADVVERFSSSVHGRALLEDQNPAAPACMDCHGSHGALPPRTSEVRLVCGQCHSVVQEHFLRSPHAASSAAAGVQCTSCHEHHAVQAPSAEMFAGDEAGHCGSCHSAEDDPARAVALRLRDDVEQLAVTIRSADDDILAAARRGLFLGDERGYLEEARGLLVRARTMTHALAPAALDDVLNRGKAMVQTTLESLATKNRVFRDRRIYTAIFFAVSVAFAIALSMYGRSLAGHWKRARPRAKGAVRGA